MPYGQYYDQNRMKFSTTAYNLDRLIAFSDGIFAFAITLLVVTIIPELPASLTEKELQSKLIDTLPDLLSYLISFFVIGFYWVAHHRILGYIKRADSTFVWLNLLLLLSITFIPFPTEILGSYGNLKTAVIVYAGSLAVVGLLQTLLWWYASDRRRLVDPTLERRVIHYQTVKSLISPVVFVLSIGIALWDATAAEYSWLAILVIRPLIERYYA